MKTSGWDLYGRYAAHVMRYIAAAYAGYVLGNQDGVGYGLLVISLLVSVVCGLFLGKYAFGCTLAFASVALITLNYCLWRDNFPDKRNLLDQKLGVIVLVALYHVFTLGTAFVALMLSTAISTRKKRA